MLVMVVVGINSALVMVALVLNRTACRRPGLRDDYCAAVTHAEAIALGAKPTDLAHDLKMGYLQIFSDSLRIDSSTAHALRVRRCPLLVRLTALYDYKSWCQEYH